MPVVAIIDYGCGNIFSVESAIKKITNDYLVTSDINELAGIRKLILPGVGSFKLAMENLDALGLSSYIKSFCDKGGELLGICLGMQLLLGKGLEGGETEGLGIIKGEVIPFIPKDSYRVPHMGWNDIHFNNDFPTLLNGIESGTSFYFVHSYYCSISEMIPCFWVDYCDKNIVIGFKKNNVSGVQFHPEKSQDAGLKLLSNFILGEK